ncbi:DRTGG domain-containing protein [Thermotoga sp.]|uniref:DRTGG domain-containing protein n=1 Tax=Thermotoga sp. TaxID=28240 RepID=UPI0025DF7DDC|nr:DRTGG domain-containing protein [Thermotoga sp.]MCD6552260.1 iron-sulfur binding hydrogenase [Thermotoga sp.]
MRIGEIVEKLGLEHVCGDLNVEVEHGFTCDLLSEVLGRAQPSTLWITVQSHVNIVAVASVVGIKGIVLCDGHEYERETVEKARENGIVLLKTSENSFVVSGKVYELGLR